MRQLALASPCRLAALLLLSASADAQVSLQGLSNGPINLRVSGMSPDGQRFVAADAFDLYQLEIQTNVWTGIGAGQGSFSSAKVANGPLRIATNYPDTATGTLNVPSLWDGAWTSLPGLGSSSGGTTGTAYDISADGQTIVGLMWISPGEAHAFRWTAAGGTVDLAPGVGFSSRANAVSNDGSTVVGWRSSGNRRATRWQGGVQTFLGSLDPANPQNGTSEALGVSANGAVIVGGSANKAFRWTQSGGMQDLGRLPSTSNAQALGVSGDGETVVGWSGTNFLDSRAVVWRPEFGSQVVDLADLLFSLGVTMAGQWTMRTAVDVSDDGTVIAGWGINPLGTVESFRVTLPRTPLAYCTAGTTSAGCTPSISAPSQPSSTFVRPCVVTVAQVEGQRAGLVFFGTSGQSNLPWGLGSTSFFCVKTPVQRSTAQFSGGTLGQCDGALVLDWNAFRLANPSGLGAPWSPGQKVWMQGWFRDPPAPRTTNLSNALEMTHTP